MPEYIHIHIHPVSFTLRTVELLGVLCTPLRNIGGARAPLAPPPSYAYAYGEQNHTSQVVRRITPFLRGQLHGALHVSRQLLLQLGCFSTVVVVVVAQ